MRIVESGQNGPYGQPMILMASIIHRKAPTHPRYKMVK